MFGDPPKKSPQRISFLLLPGFSMIGVAAMVDPLRWANTISERSRYAWEIISVSGGPVKSSDKITLMADKSIDNVNKTEMLIVCAGYNPKAQVNKKLLGSIRRLAALGVDIGAQDTGSYILAAAGLLDGYNATIHWENHDSYLEAFRHVNVVRELFEIDRNRFSCSGGLSGLDMMLYLIQRQHGSELANAISDKLIYHHTREGSQPQRMSLQSRFGISNQKLLETAEYMQGHLETPASIPELAARVNISERELERLFRKYLQSTPVAFYRRLRLEKARLLLRQTSHSITNVAIRCGFGSTSHFSRCYRKHYGCAPKEERKQPFHHTP
jgi:transcriptional regulator GlxA family with amidase domain